MSLRTELKERALQVQRDTDKPSTPQENLELKGSLIEAYLLKQVYEAADTGELQVIIMGDILIPGKRRGFSCIIGAEKICHFCEKFNLDYKRGNGKHYICFN